MRKNEAGKIDTDRRLELVRTIRMQNRQDRQLIRQRHSLLYGEDAFAERGEIYGLESADILLADGRTGKGAPSERERDKAATDTVKSGALTGFRIRFLLAVLLLAAFIICDRTGYSYKGESADTIFERMTESVEIPSFLQYNKNASQK